MKRIQLFLIGACIAAGSVFAQDATNWQSSVAKIKELIKTSPDQASEEAGQLLKGKNKKNIDLVVAIGRAYLDAGKATEAEMYVELAKKVDKRSAASSVLEGDIALSKQDAGTACQLYEQAIYFDPNCEDAYLKYAEIYKSGNPLLAIEKLEQLKGVNPNSIVADKGLAEVYYMSNKFDKAAEAYARFIDSPEAKENDIVKYAFALFLNHKFEESLEVVNKGLQLNGRHAAFNRLAMYNYTDLKRYEEAEKAANAFFTGSDKADFSYLDYMYYGHLLNAVKKYDEAVVQYEKALSLDPTKTNLWLEVSNAYEQKNDYKKAIEAYEKYFKSLESEKQSPDVQFQLGKLYYGQATQADSLVITPVERTSALAAADTIFAAIAKSAPDSYLGNFWRARTNSTLDPETTKGLAKPFYEEVATLLQSKNDTRYNSVLIECYSYLGYYYLVANKLPESKEYWNKILAIDPTNATAKKALEGIK